MHPPTALHLADVYFGDYRKDAYVKHKAELDALYALGEPSSSGSVAKL